MENKNKKKKQNKKEKDKVFEVLKIICLVGVGILLIELIIFGFLVLSNRKDISIDLAKKIVATDNGYIISGSSNISNSDLSSEFGKITIYEDDKKIEEFKYDKYYTNTFYDVKKISDGYIAVGAVEKDKKSHKAGTADAIIVRFDNNGKVVWDKLYNELDNAYFKSLIVDNDSIVVVGSSVYASDVIGNEDKGGAIIVKYGLDGNIIVNNHFGKNKVGVFNDVIKVDDYYYAVGNSVTDNAIIVKLNNNLEKIAINNYNGTGRKGFVSLANANDSLYVTCSKNKVKKGQSVGYATIVQYNYDLKKQNSVMYKNNNHSVWNDIIDYNGNLYVVGDGAIKRTKKKSILVQYSYRGLLASYNYSLDSTFTSEFDYNNDEFYNSLIVKDNKILVAGYTNSKLKDIGSNKYKFMPIINSYDLSGNLLKQKK